MNIAVALSLRCYALNVCQSVHELLHTLLADLQGIVGEIYCSTIMCREYKEPDSHRRIRLLERRVIACEELFRVIAGVMGTYGCGTQADMNMAAWRSVMPVDYRLI